MASESPGPPLFDEAAIEKLRAVAGDQAEAFIKEMAQLFLDETAKSLAELSGARDQGDWRLVSRTAHSVKSSAATLGFLRLSGACKVLELDTKREVETPQSRALVAAVLEQFEAVRPTLKRLGGAAG
jgi:HPt (histidine-containing phosphotransfer) domain-containing protein